MMICLHYHREHLQSHLIQVAASLQSPQEDLGQVHGHQNVNLGHVLEENTVELRHDLQARLDLAGVRVPEAIVADHDLTIAVPGLDRGQGRTIHVVDHVPGVILQTGVGWTDVEVSVEGTTTVERTINHVSRPIRTTEATIEVVVVEATEIIVILEIIEISGAVEAEVAITTITTVDLVEGSEVVTETSGIVGMIEAGIIPGIEAGRSVGITRMR